MRNALVLPLLLLTACATTSTMSSNDAEAYSRGAEPRFITAFNAGNADAVAAMYADDAVLLVQNAPIDRCNAAIGDAYLYAFRTGHTKHYIASDIIVLSHDIV